MWPGGKELLGKKHRPGGASPRRLRPASAECGGLIGRPAGRPYREREPSLGDRRVGPPGPFNASCLMIFAQKLLAPGPGTQSESRLGGHLFRSTLNGSLFSDPPALQEGMIPKGIQRAPCLWTGLLARPKDRVVWSSVGSWADGMRAGFKPAPTTGRPKPASSAPSG